MQFIKHPKLERILSISNFSAQQEFPAFFIFFVCFTRLFSRYVV